VFPLIRLFRLFLYNSEMSPWNLDVSERRRGSPERLYLRNTKRNLRMYTHGSNRIPACDPSVRTVQDLGPRSSLYATFHPPWKARLSRVCSVLLKHINFKVHKYILWYLHLWKYNHYCSLLSSTLIKLWAGNKECISIHYYMWRNFGLARIFSKTFLNMFLKWCKICEA
jgi:hypothetical protein